MSLNNSLFHPHIIRQIQDMYLGYHYETLSDANGDPEKAFDRFRSHPGRSQKYMRGTNGLHARKKVLRMVWK
jgi:hypothetical protein